MVKAERQQDVMHSGSWLFPRQDIMNPIGTRQLHRMFVAPARAASITRHMGPTKANPLMYDNEDRLDLAASEHGSQSCWTIRAAKAVHIYFFTQDTVYMRF